MWVGQAHPKHALPALANPFRCAAATEAGLVAATPSVGKNDSLLNMSQAFPEWAKQLTLQPIHASQSYFAARIGYTVTL